MERRPLIGIMAVKQANRRLPFAEGAFFKALMVVGRSLGVKVVVFSPADIDWQRKTIVGWTYSDTSNSWISRQCHFPDVIYDRIFPTRSPNSIAALRMAHRLRRQPGVLFFGNALNGKWQVYKALAEDSSIRPCLPETELCSSGDVLEAMLRRHKVVFFKPDLGTQGKGIMRIQVLDNKRLYYKGRDRNSVTFAGIAAGFAELYRVARNFAAGRRYLVQQGLPLHVYRNSPCDVRVIVQKDGQGQWVITGHAVRVGPAAGVTSNLHGGGRAIELQVLLEHLFPEDEEKQKQVLSEIEALALMVAHKLDEMLGRFGELGLDIGLQRDGKIWLIEANSKPGRKVFLYTKDFEARRRSIVNPVAYCRYLYFSQQDNQA